MLSNSSRLCNGKHNQSDDKLNHHDHDGRTIKSSTDEQRNPSIIKVNEMKTTRKIAYGTSVLLGKAKKIFSTATMKLSLKWWGVTYGEKCHFFGKTFLKIHPSATASIGNNCIFRSSFESNTIGLKQYCYLSASRNASLKIGNNCGLSGAVISAQHSIIIGNRVMLGANVTITDSDRHPLNAKLRAQGVGGKAKEVIIGDDVWLGMNVVILKGVSIGKNSIIAANSIVTSNIPEGIIAGGVPAKQISRISD